MEKFLKQLEEALEQIGLKKAKPVFLRNVLYKTDEFDFKESSLSEIMKIARDQHEFIIIVLALQDPSDGSPVPLYFVQIPNNVEVPDSYDDIYENPQKYKASNGEKVKWLLYQDPDPAENKLPMSYLTKGTSFEEIFKKVQEGLEEDIMMLIDFSSHLMISEN